MPWLPRHHLLAAAILLALASFGVVSLLCDGARSDDLTAVPAVRAEADLRALTEYQAGRRGLGFGIPQGWSAAALERVRRRRSRATASVSARSWKFVGPQPIVGEIPTFAGNRVGSAIASANGRVTAIAPDPTSAGRLLIGTAGGGVWMSTDSGQTFADIFASSESIGMIGSLALDPTTVPPTIYAGEGEGDFSADAYYGQGLFVSSDLGQSWTQETGNGAFTNVAIGRIAIDTSVTPRRLFAAVSIGSSGSRAEASIVESNIVRNGIWRSTDGGTGWAQIPLAPLNACPIFNGYCPGEDVVIDPALPANVYASLFQDGVFHSTDRGTTWSKITFPNIQNDRIGRASVAALGGIVYVAIGAWDGIEYTGFFKSLDSGKTWAQVATPAAMIAGTTIDGTSSANWSQSAFDQALAIDPSDRTGATVVFGGVGIYRSTNGGNSWAFLGSNGGVHSDQHALAFDPSNPSRVFVGNDGGLFAYNSGANAWSALNAGFSATQMEAIGPHPTDNSTVLAGAGENGTVRAASTLSSPSWSAADGLDGGFALFDRNAPLRAYHSYATLSGGPSIGVSQDGGIIWSSAAPTSSLRAAMQAANDRGAAFYPPLATYPQLSNRVYFGAHSVYVSTDGGNSWSQQTTQDLSGGCKTGACALQDLELSPAQSGIGFALSTQTFSTLPTTPFRIFYTSQAAVQVDATHPNGGLWNDVTINLPFSPSQTQATGIALNPFNPAVAYLSVSGFTAATGIGHVFVTTNSGAYWSQTDGNPNNLVPPPPGALPDVPVLRTLVDSTDITGSTVFAATDIGVFRSTDSGVSWSEFDLGTFPLVPVFDLEQNKNGAIFAATHGRGAYRLDPALTATVSATPTSSPTATAIPTATATATASANPTGTPTATATKTATPTPTATTVPSRLSYSPARLSFGSRAYADTGQVSAPRYLTLSNNGKTAITLSGNALSGAAASDFTVVSGQSSCTNQIDPHAKCRYSLVFAPSALGSRGASLMIQHNGTNGPITVPLTGSAIPPPIAIRPKSLNMGLAHSGSPALGSFSIQNNGPVSVTIQSVSSDNAEFAPDAGCNGPLAPRSICTVKVTFTPMTGGQRRTYMRVTDNAKGSPQRLRVSGRGLGSLLTNSERKGAPPRGRPFD